MHQRGIVTFLIRYKGMLQEIVTHPRADFLPAGSRYLRNCLRYWGRYAILRIEKGKARDTAYPQMNSFNLRQAVIIASNGGYFLFPRKIV